MSLYSAASSAARRISENRKASYSFSAFLIIATIIGARNHKASTAATASLNSSLY